jgi:hypothetical protein
VVAPHEQDAGDQRVGEDRGEAARVRPVAGHEQQQDEPDALVGQVAVVDADGDGSRADGRGLENPWAAAP